MGCFSSSTKSQGNQQQIGTNTSSSQTNQSFANPLAQGFQNQMMQNVNQMYNQAQTPLYGQAQIAQNLQGLNQLANSSIKNLQGQLARTGGMQGGGQAQGISNILQNKGNQAFNFTSQLPMLNQQAKMAGEGQAIGLGNQLQSQFLRDTSQTGNSYSSNTGTNQNVTTSDPSVMSDIGQSIAIAAGAMGMPSAAMTQPTPQAVQGQNYNLAMQPGADDSGIQSAVGQGLSASNVQAPAAPAVGQDSPYIDQQYGNGAYNPFATWYTQGG